MKTKTVNKTKRNVIKVLLIAVLVFALVIAFDFLIGLIIGGSPYRNIVLFAALSIIISLLCTFAYFGKEKFKQIKASLLSVITISFLVLLLFAVSYNCFNELTADNNYEEYKATVTETLYGRDNHFEVFFTDKNGNEASDEIFTLKYIILSDEEEEEMLKAGDTITVREYRGGFGYPIYRISELRLLKS